MGIKKTTFVDSAQQEDPGVVGQIMRAKPSSVCIWVHYGKRKKPINRRIQDLRNRDKRKRYKRSDRREDDPISKGKAARRKRELAEGRDPGVVDWDSIDANGEPLISFVPTSKLRRELKRMLVNTPGRDPARKRIVQKLGVQFARYYTRYRRQAEARAGRGSGYVMVESERAAAEQCAVNLILKGVTPRELLEHWDKHIGNFISALVIPPLSFLKSPAAIDQVVCKQLGAGTQPKRKQQSVPSSGGKPVRVERIRPIGGNTFSDKGALHVGLRAALTEAGFNVNMLNDRYLLSVQYNACCVARDEHVFLSSKMGEMVKWLAENFVKQKGLLDGD